MRTTIDKVGRVVIPAPIRSAALLSPGTELEVTVENGVVRLRRVVSGPQLVKDGGGWIARPTVPPDQVPEIDFARLVEEERDRWPW
jgi:AbrB family looped-hinge helix DNA binding protein